VLLAVCLLIAYSFSGLYFVHNRLQTSADEIALTGAKKLNDRNRIGQMNNMIARCRQLVYASRDDKNSVQKEFPDIERFADQLLEEARQSALELEKERKKMRAVAEDEAVKAMRAKFNSIKTTYAMELPWITVRTPRVIGLGLGSIEGTESNVEEFDQFEKLKKADRDQQNTVSYTKMSLYKGNRHQRLIEDDSDLPFYLSSLPAQIESEVAPARTILPATYREADDEPVPTATKVTLDLRVENGIGPKNAGTMRAIGTAITTGASNQD
jgi:ElaB/YqjD/DUF883 family membrane-anchored ribosome-binding protein